MKFPEAQRLSYSAVPYCLYLLLAGVFWIPYLRQLNADGVSYLSIASEYASGHWPTAVNTYWSPLFSWLLAAGIAVKAPPFVFARLLLIAFGLLGLFGLQQVLAIFELRPTIAAGARIAAVPMFCYFALHDVTADVLALALLLLYLRLTCARQLTAVRWAWAGALGALLYLAKAYCFVFVFAQLLIIAAIRICAASDADAKWRIARRWATAVATLVLLSAPWLILIGKKTGRPTLSTAGSYNLALAVAGPSGHPMLREGLFAPPNAYAVSIWEDPDAMDLRTPAEPSPSRAVVRRLKIFAHNLAEFARYQLSACPLTPLILVLFAYTIVSCWRRGKPDIPAAVLLASYVIYPAAYFLTFIEHRYIWIEDVVVLVMAAYVLDWLYRRGAPPQRTLAFAGIIIAISFSWAPLFIVVKHRNDLHSIARLVPALQQLNMRGNIASNARWDDTQYLAYVLGLRYYGMPGAGSEKATDTALRREHIRYFFEWRVPGAPRPPGEKLFDSAVLDVYALPPG